MALAWFRSMRLAFLALAFCCPVDGQAADAETETWRTNPWRNPNGTLTRETTVRPSAAGENAGGATGEPLTYVPPGSRNQRAVPRDAFNRFAGGGATDDRGIDSADTKWRRQARTTGVRMRMLNGPEAAFSSEGVSSSSERGSRNFMGAVVPLNPRWELTALNKLADFKQLESGNRAGLDALTLRIGANPSVSFRPWFEATPYIGLGDRGGWGVGFAAGVAKSWSSGMSLEGEAHYGQPWDEGYETAVQDGKSHGVRLRGSMPVDRRLTLTAEAGYEWLELGRRAPGGSERAGHRGDWQVRAEYKLLKRDDAYMGYGFREPTLWNEQLVPVEFGVFADIYGQRYRRPDGFTALNPAEESFRQRVGLFYYQAVSPHIGFNMEAYVGADPGRDIREGDLYGLSIRLNLVVSPRLRAWFGWGYENGSSDLSGGGGPDKNFSFGFNWNF